MSDEAQKPAEDILIPESVKVTYGKNEYELKPLSIGSIIRLSRIIGIRFGKMYDIFLEEISHGEKMEKLLSALDENEILEIISISLKIEKQEAEDNFKALDAIRVLRSIFQQEDVGKIFFEVRLIKEAMQNA